MLNRNIFRGFNAYIYLSKQLVQKKIYRLNWKLFLLLYNKKINETISEL